MNEIELVEYINSSDTRDGLFQLIWSISYLLMPWWPGHQGINKNGIDSMG